MEDENLAPFHYHQHTHASSQYFILCVRGYNFHYANNYIIIMMFSDYFSAQFCSPWS